jgi:hypothetical protein
MAKGSTVIIGCRLPHGLVISHPLAKGVTATIAGMNKARIIGADHVTTEIDADIWAAWKLTHEDFAPLKSGAIFEARSQSEAASKAKEVRKEKTGFESMDPKAMGVKPAEAE